MRPTSTKTKNKTIVTEKSTRETKSHVMRREGV
jgi:hypothetical protein